MSRSTKLGIWLVMAVACLALAVTVAPRLFAQDSATADKTPAASADAPAEAAPTISYRNLFEVLKDGGVMIGPMLVCSFITLVFVFERAISLRRGRVIPRPSSSGSCTRCARASWTATARWRCARKAAARSPRSSPP